MPDPGRGGRLPRTGDAAERVGERGRGDDGLDQLAELANDEARGLRRAESNGNVHLVAQNVALRVLGGDLHAGVRGDEARDHRTDQQGTEVVGGRDAERARGLPARSVQSV